MLSDMQLQEGSTSATEIVHIVQALQRHVNMASYTALDHDSEAFWTLNTFKALCSAAVHNLKGPSQGMPPGVISFHCEAAMAALSQYGCKVKESPPYGSEDADQELLHKICKVVNVLSLFLLSSFDHVPHRI